MDESLKMCANYYGHMTKMATMPIYRKCPLNSYSSELEGR